MANYGILSLSLFLGTLCLVILNTDCKLVNLNTYKGMLIDLHNDFRRKVPASNMREVSWDSHLADKAGYWSKWCTYERHNDKHHRKYGENLFIGELGDNQRVIFDAVQKWFDQGNIYRYQPFDSNCGTTCEYTQLVWADTEKVGCAMNKCGRLFNGYQTLHDVMLFVCFYGTRGNVQGEYPYQTGSHCDNCPSGTGCQDRLCSANVDSWKSNEGLSVAGEHLPQDPDWTENPAYLYAEGRPTSYSRRYPNDLRYRRVQEERRQRQEQLRRQREEARRQQEERRRQEQLAEQRRQQEERRRREEAEQRRLQEEQRRAPTAYEDRRLKPSEYYIDRQYTYRDEYNRECSCQCRRSTPVAPSSLQRSQQQSYAPEAIQSRQYSDLTQAEKYELISVHNLMRDERQLSRIFWSAELEKWSGYIIRCDKEFPGPRHTYTNFGKMLSTEDLYTFVHAWASEGGNVSRIKKHCRAANEDFNCNRHSNIMTAGIHHFACATTRCRNHRQIVCLYR